MRVKLDVVWYDHCMKRLNEVNMLPEEGTLRYC